MSPLYNLQLLPIIILKTLGFSQILKKAYQYLHTHTHLVKLNLIH